MKSAEKTRQEERTPVRERVKRLNKKATASPGKFPLMKQQLLDLYFKKKSPKASKARDKAEPDSNNKYKNQGARDSPLEGEPREDRFCPDQAGSQNLPSRDPEPNSEVRGRNWSLAAQKRALKALERWPPDGNPNTQSPKRGKSMKRLQGPAKGKETREGTETVLQKWLRKEKQGFEAKNTSSGPGEKG